MTTNVATEMLFLRFCVAFAALALSFMLALSLVHKYQGGLYGDTEIPSPVTAAMRRARTFFVTVVLSIAAIAGVVAYVLHPLVSPEVWANFVLPAAVGTGVSMLYSGLTRFDLVRPRQSA